MRLVIGLSIAAVAIAAASCSDKPAEQTPPRTAEQQRAIDSTVGASKLPGAGGVRGALAASDSAAVRAKTLDSLSKTP
jgi:hypothetical protein